MTNPPTPPYTEATEAAPSVLDEAVAVAATALHTHATEPYGDVALSPARAAIIAVNALVKAGLLLPEGAETRTEYVVQIRREDGSARAVDSIPLPTEDLAHEVAAEPFSSPGVRADVVRRRVFDAVIASYVDAVRLAEGDSSKGDLQ